VRLLVVLACSAVLLPFALSLAGGRAGEREPAEPAPRAAEAGRAGSAALLSLHASPEPEGAPEEKPPAGGQAVPAPSASLRVPVLIGPELGDLRLELVDRATGRPLAGEVELWQLDLPADKDFTAGDRMYCKFPMTAEGTTLHGLPAGRYRAFLPGRRSDSPDPPEVVVSAGGAAAALAIDLPRLTRYVLDLRDVGGWSIGSSHLDRTQARVPREKAPFAEERRARCGRGASSNCIIGCGAGSRPNPIVARGERGFDAGVHAERTPAGGSRSMYRFQPDGLESVLFEPPAFAVNARSEQLAGDPPIEVRTMVAVALPLGYFDESIRLPDGAFACERGAHIRVECQPLPFEPDSPPDLWRSCPIKVRVIMDGHLTLRFTYRIEEGPPPVRTLEPVSRR
jgi:hypothetical protein